MCERISGTTQLARSRINRAIIPTLAGFSFSALLALTVVDAKVGDINLQFTTYYTLLSFLSYLSAFNLQNYKLRKWHEQLDNALMEAASLSLLLAISSIILVSNDDRTLYKYGMVLLALGIWVVNEAVHGYLTWKTLGRKRPEEAR